MSILKNERCRLAWATCVQNQSKDGKNMVFGILKEIKEGEYRVICTPVEVKSIVAAGHAQALLSFADLLADQHLIAQGR